MHRISSNSTLFLKIFLPTFWISFFGIFTMAVVLSDVKNLSAFNFAYIKIGIAVFFLLFSTLFYFTLMQLLRVELDGQFVYATNYLNTYRYPYHNVERITERDLGLFTLVKIHLKEPGKFGKTITFLLDEAMLDDFFEKNPEMVAVLNGLWGKAGSNGLGA